MSCPLFPPWLCVAVGVVDNAPLRDSLPYAVSPHVVFAGPSVVGSNGVWSKRPINETLSVTAALGKPPIVERNPGSVEEREESRRRVGRNTRVSQEIAVGGRERSDAGASASPLETDVVIPFVFDQFTVGAEAEIAPR